MRRPKLSTRKFSAWKKKKKGMEKSGFNTDKGKGKGDLGHSEVT